MEETTRTNPSGLQGQTGNAGPYDADSSSRNASAQPSNAPRQAQDAYEPGKSSSLGSYAQDSYAQPRQTIADRGHQAQQAATKWMQQTRAETDAYVHQKPWNAVAVAAGIGFLVGLMLRR